MGLREVQRFGYKMDHPFSVLKNIIIIIVGSLFILFSIFVLFGGGFSLAGILFGIGVFLIGFSILSNKLLKRRRMIHNY